MSQQLPIDAVLPGLIGNLRIHPCAVLQAPTGAGKTTRVPPALLAAGLAGEKQIILVEPRRIAARAAAIRIAQETGERVGAKVGYAVRFDRQAGAGTRILSVTPGILLRLFHDDPYLEGVGILIFDEFHERSLECDLALGMARLVRETVNPQLKIVVMSATLDAHNVSHYLGDCPITTSEGRMYPVETVYRPLQRDDEDDLEAAQEAVEFLLGKTTGDILVFLPDINEIRQMTDRLEPLAQSENLAIFPLYGDLPPDKQDMALRPQDRRRIVLATNVAETSVTVEGITGVVDTGTAWQMLYDPAVGLDRLVRVAIARDSTEQRRGRAGRTQPGVCVRLWSEIAQQSRAPRTLPEIHRADLAGAVLQLLSFGESDPSRFPWIDVPSPAASEQALKLLRLLGAIDGLSLTALGKRMAKLPVHPRLSRLLLAGWEHNCLSETALTAALLSERDPFPKPIPKRANTTSDLWDKLEALARFEQTEQWQTELGPLNRQAARQLLQVRNQLCRLTSESERPNHQPAEDLEAGLGKSLLAAFPDRLCKRRTPGNDKALMVGGRGAILAHSSGVKQANLFIALDIDAGAGETRIRQAHGIERDWLPRQHLSISTPVEWSEQDQKVVAFKRTQFLDLTLDENSALVPDTEQTTRLLLMHAKAHWREILPKEENEAAQFLLRWESLRDWLPEAALPEVNEATIAELLEWIAPGRRSFAELREADWLSVLRQKLTTEQWNLIHREAPERIEVPSGSSIRLEYQRGRSPILAVRIQELFGMLETPRIARGKVPVLLHLLAPNHRPQQVTEDLASFWKNTYPIVRKELRVRYPRHSWPEDPYSAIAEKRPRRK